MSKTGKIFLKSIKALFFLLILIINVLVLWRILFSGDPSSAKGLMINESTAAAFKKSGGELKVYTQQQRTISSSGRFSVTSCVFIPEAEQIQITVRYNNSTLKHLARDYKLQSAPDRENEVFDVTIVKTIDLTPENKEDNLDPDTLEEIRYFPSGEPECAYKTLYSYRRYIFDGVTYDDAVGLFVDFYYIDDKDYAEKPYDVLCIYDSEMPLEEAKLSASDKKALRKAKEN